MRWGLAIGLAAAIAGRGAAGSPAQGSNADDPWAPLRPILGAWASTSHGQPGDGSGTREYRLVLNDRFIRVTNTATYPPQERNPRGETHEDAGYISLDKARKAFVYRQFHSEGFVNTFVSESIAPDRIVFTSEAIENIPAGWRARETYRVFSTDEWGEVFELAAPAKPFEVYSETRLKRAR